MKKQRTYYLTLSQTFPATHPRKGEPTYFKEKFEQAQAITKAGKFPCVLPYPDFIDPKYHTIRGNYDRWYKIFKQIYAGEACLSLRVWSGKPYRSKMIEICRLTKDDGIGLQKLELKLASYLPFYIEVDRIDEDRRKDAIHVGILAHNDGLSLNDWQAWFEQYDFSKPLAIIHFTNFRY